MGGKTYTDIDRDDFECGKNRRETKGRDKTSLEVSTEKVENFDFDTDSDSWRKYSSRNHE